ncbi:Anaphase-promoting complex subunit 1 [Trichoplax sp. H2]|nr:Anaphase-promoting complex subunit 1 [Trichoplax sp. H2]|eukprot:RDD40313.1 Anaphase-promoting complex subunit 1 [Trichoplax sp. H2]
MEDFIPNGKIYYRDRHPLGKNDENGYQEQKDFWKVTYYADDQDEGNVATEKEIYVCDKTVVLSFSGIGDTNKIVKTFTVETPIIDVLWCTFSEDTNTKRHHGAKNQKLCIIEQNFISFYAEDGSFFTSSTPFPVQHVWNISTGLLIQRRFTESEYEKHGKRIPELYTISNPIDEPHPVFINLESGESKYFYGPEYQVVTTIREPEFILIFDKNRNKHSLWQPRKLKTENTSDSFNTDPLASVNFTDQRLHNLTTKSQNLHHSAALSPFRSYTPPPVNSSVISHHRNTPVSTLIPHMPAQQVHPLQGRDDINRLQQHPTIGHQTPTASSIQLSLNRQGRDFSFVKTNIYSTEPLQPVLSEICLSKIWEEDICLASVAKKAFFATDFYGRKYFYCLVGDQLRVYQYHDMNFEYKLTIESKDVACMTETGIIAVLDNASNGYFYNGLLQICQLNFDLWKIPGSIQFLYQWAFDTLIVTNNYGKMFRIPLLKLPSNVIVKSSLAALHQLLPEEIGFTILAQYLKASVNKSYDNIECSLEVFVRFLLWLISEKGSLEEVSGTGTRIGTDIWSAVLQTPIHARYTKEDLLDVIVTKCIKPDKNWIGYQHLPSILFSLHLIYEEFKLDSTAATSLYPLAQFLYFCASILDAKFYLDYYRRDFPKLFTYNLQEVVPTERLSQTMPSYITSYPINVRNWMIQCFRRLKQDTKLYYIPRICSRLELIGKICTKFTGNEEAIAEPIFRYEYYMFDINNRDQILNSSDVYIGNTISEQCLMLLVAYDFRSWKLHSLTFGVQIILHQILNDCRRNPSGSWPKLAYELINRQDLIGQTKLRSNRQRFSDDQTKTTNEILEEDVDESTSVSNKVTNLIFGKDLRLREVGRLLRSSKPVPVSVARKPESSDHEYIEQQEEWLYTISQRTMALPVGRGMLTLFKSSPIVAEVVSIPSLNLTGRIPPKNAIIKLEMSNYPGLTDWPLFHNGVAAGISIMPGLSQIDSTWIVYNKPQNEQSTNEHAGFLMALGLSGHLSNLKATSIHDYLSMGHSMISIGLLLGIAAAKRGTMDLAVTKMLSVHIRALLPPTSAELNISQDVQIASLIGIGLLFEGSLHRSMVKMLLIEIGRGPGPEMDNCTDRESYSVAAGIALGMITLGRGDCSPGLSDLTISDYLYNYIVGGNKDVTKRAIDEKSSPSSYLIKEGVNINVNVTAPGAILSLGLMFLKTNNRSIADWFIAPKTQTLLEASRPDFLLLKTWSRYLIMWDSILPTTAWVENQIPPIAQEHGFSNVKVDKTLDYELLSQVKLYITAGACMAIGFRFAGSANAEAFSTLTHYLNFVIKLQQNPRISEEAGKCTIEMCLGTICLALAMVMSGTGNLTVLKTLRKLHSQLGSTEINYGRHMAIHMSIGLLFLGGGRYTLNTTNESVAYLVASLYPYFPANSCDNKYHLQALRHLYALASQPRIMVTRNIDDGDPVYVPISVTLKATENYQRCKLNLTTPCLLPELHLIEQINIEGPRYWPIRLELENDSKLQKALLDNHGTVFVKRRAGFLNYKSDPKGLQNALARDFSIEKESLFCQPSKINKIKSLTSNKNLLAFAELLCNNTKNDTDQEYHLKALFSSLLFECVKEEKTEIITICMTIYHILHELSAKIYNPLNFVELNLMISFYEMWIKQSVTETLISNELLEYIKSYVSCYMLDDITGTFKEPDTFLEYVKDGAKLITANLGTLEHLASFLQLYDVPPAYQIFGMNEDGGYPSDLLSLFMKFGGNPPAETVLRVLPVIKMISSNKDNMDYE